VADSLTTLLTAALALAAIVGVIVLLGRVLRRTSLVRAGSAGRSLIVKETLTLDARRRLWLIQHGERSVLLLTGGANDVVVGWLDGPAPP
jgi:flagellar protein FliO/FliZ